MWRLRQLLRRIRKTLAWLPILWKTEDWDAEFGVRLLQFHLRRVAKYLDEKGHSLSHKQDARRIRTACELIDKVYGEEYAHEFAEILEQKYGKKKMEFKTMPDGQIMLCTEYERKYGPQQIKAIEAEERMLIRKCAAKHRKAHRILWEFIEHNIQHWWD